MFFLCLQQSGIKLLLWCFDLEGLVERIKYPLGDIFAPAYGKLSSKKSGESVVEKKCRSWKYLHVETSSDPTLTLFLLSADIRMHSPHRAEITRCNMRPEPSYNGGPHGLSVYGCSFLRVRTHLSGTCTTPLMILLCSVEASGDVWLNS